MGKLGLEPVDPDEADTFKNWK